MTRWFQPFALASAVIALASAHAQPPGDDAPPRKAAADTPGGPPVVTAKGWAVADGETGKLLWGSKEKDPLPLASTSKIMTAHVVLTLAAESEKVLDEVIHFSERADKTPGTSSDLKAGDKVAVRDLLYGLLLPSGNDAATALAEHFGARFKHEGKDAVERFVAEMNRTAKAVGMQETSYLDPHGLGLNKASPRDLLALAFAAMKNPTFASYVSTRRHKCRVADKDGNTRDVVWSNTNKLLDIEGYEGVKTGTTTAAGACLVSRGTRDGDRLLVVVLGSTTGDNRYTDTRNLYKWAWAERRGK